MPREVLKTVSSTSGKKKHCSTMPEAIKKTKPRLHSISLSV